MAGFHCHKGCTAGSFSISIQRMPEYPSCSAASLPVSPQASICCMFFFHSSSFYTSVQASLFLSSLRSTSVHSETQQVINQFWSLRPTCVLFFASFYTLVLLISWEKKKKIGWSFSPFQRSPWFETQELNENLSCSNDTLLSSCEEREVFFHSPQGRPEIHKELKIFIVPQLYQTQQRLSFPSNLLSFT